MNQVDQTVTTNSDGTSFNAGRIFPWLATGAFAALAVANGYLFNRVDLLEKQVVEERTAATAEISSLKETTAAAALSAQQNFVELTNTLEAGTRNVSVAAQRAAQVAQRNAEQMVSELAAKQRASDAEIAKAMGEVKEVRTVAETHAAQVTGLESSVGSVKAEVEHTKSALDSTIADLHSVRGDLGVQSGLIATNAKELQALRELGDRQYFEFTLRKGAGPAKMGNMSVELKKSDAKRNKYNIQIMADDKLVEKKDRTVNEPVQMYVGGARQPYEIVVNTVQKDAITGYLAVPKTLQARR